MGRKAKDLAPLTINKLNKAGMHFVGHVSGLALRISNTGSKSWILRISIAGKRRDMGLGAYPEITLARAKELAVEKRLMVQNGIDPIQARKSAQASLRAERESFITFQDAALQYIAAHENGWKNKKHASQWRNTLATYAYPIVGSLHVKDIELNHILKVLEPIWYSKTETANRVRSRMELVLDWAKVRGSREGDNPARWKGNLDAVLPARSKVSKIRHHKALEWHLASSLMLNLKQQEGVSAKALELALLTACRSGEVRFATWSEFDLERRVWVIPAERMKAEKEHRIPLTQSMLELLKSVPKIAGSDYVFINSQGKPLSDMALTQVLRRMEIDSTVHGLRSTFRDWAGESTAFPREVIEHALAHKLKDKAEAAYARGDLFTKRIKLMEAWDEFLNNPVVYNNNVKTIGKGVKHG
ncbi:MAG: Prophage CP4-57 integrase [Proteobacteria bacterium]|nr:MAG: Prophage CP4-57 integrase [Pseudomonadota bacterium]